MTAAEAVRRIQTLDRELAGLRQQRAAFLPLARILVTPAAALRGPGPQSAPTKGAHQQ